MVSSTETGSSGVVLAVGGMTPSFLPIKGKHAGAYGFLDGNRGSSGVMLEESLGLELGVRLKAPLEGSCQPSAG